MHDELVAFRRDLHAHPELSRYEVRTTERVGERLKAAGLDPQPLSGTGLYCDIGDPGAPIVALRADIDALPVTETTGLPFASTVPGIAHACGHDVHTTVVLGAGLLLARLLGEDFPGRSPRRVRLVFQPAEEVTPGGALDVVAAGVLEGANAVYALHCDPRLDVGGIGSRVGAITSAFDHVRVVLHGPGGHTSRPHLTADLVYALAQVVSQVPAAMVRRIDPRSVVNLTWGRIEAGHAANAVPSEGLLEGSLRCMDSRTWEVVAEIVEELVAAVSSPYGVTSEVAVTRGVPPVDNDELRVDALERAARAVLGPDSVSLAEQSLGGEDFAWYLREVPGALARLGTRTPGGRTYDLHQGDLVVDERAVAVGTRLLVALALGIR